VSKSITVENCTTFTADLVALKVDVQIPYTANITLEDDSTTIVNGIWNGFTVITIDDGTELGIFSLEAN